MGVHNFPKNISPEVNVIALLGFEPTYIEDTVQYFCYDVMVDRKVKRKVVLKNKPYLVAFHESILVNL